MLSIFYRDDDGSALDITAYVNLSDANFKNTTNAEQGSIGTNTFDIDDPTGVLNIVGHRRVWAMEDSAPVGQQLIFWGYTADRDVTRTSAPVLAARKWTATIVDINSLLQRKVMAGNDTDRPAETDVERVQWLMTTGEAGFFDDTTTYIDTSNPVAMDAADYNGQMFSAILDDCAQQSGKNYYARFPYDSGITDYRAAVWYGSDAVTLATVGLRISNVLTDVDARVGDGNPGSGDDWTWEPSFDSSLNRDPSRVYSGIFGNYDGGYTYRTRTATIAEFANRDTIASWPNVKTLAKAQARGDRELNDLHSEEDVIHTTILVTPEHVNDAMAGDLIQGRFSHMPTYESFRQLRILNRTVTFITPEVYQIDYDLTPLPIPPESFLIAIINSGYVGGAPTDLSDNPWTPVFWTGDYASPLQFPGPGGSGSMAMWARAIVPGESTTVIHIQGHAAQAQSIWVMQVAGCDFTSMTSDYGAGWHPGMMNFSIDSPSAGVDSVWIGAFMLQKVNYGQWTDMDTLQGTNIFYTNGAGAVLACHINDDSPPAAWSAWAEGTGVLTVEGNCPEPGGGGCSGATPDYNGAGWGWGGLLFDKLGTFSVIQQTMNYGIGVDLTVTLDVSP